MPITIQNIIERELKAFEKEFPLITNEKFEVIPDSEKDKIKAGILEEFIRENAKKLKLFLSGSHSRLLEQVRLSLVGEIEKENRELPKTKCINAENHLFGSCFSCEKIKGYNSALSDSLAIINRIMKQ